MLKGSARGWNWCEEDSTDSDVMNNPMRTRKERDEARQRIETREILRKELRHRRGY